MENKNEEFSLDLNGTKLVAQIKELAEQANGSTIIRFGDTMIHTTAVMSPQEKEDQGFFPLMVDYEEKYYAAGKIKGPRYIKRETRPSDEAICNARLIDRAIRPLFPPSLKNEVQTIATVLSWDAQNEPDVSSLLGISIALSISDIPWNGPIAAVRVSIIEGQFILNPTYEQREQSHVDVVFAGIEKNGEIIINMIESRFNEAQEETIAEAFRFARPYLKKLIDFQKNIQKSWGKKKAELSEKASDPAFEEEIRALVNNGIENSVYQKNKKTRQEATKKVKDRITEYVLEKYPEDKEKLRYAKNFYDEEVERIIHENVLKHDKRPDGRKSDEIRPIHGEIAFVPRAHGSGFFCRGETKSLSIVTLGAPGDSQLIDGMELVGKKRFLHHYNFPPYSTGEVKFLRAPGRREIGHGMLAEKTLLPLIPSVEAFPYTIRVVSEILSSNGSSSMAALTSSAMALMDAGIPLKSLATGISLGLITDDKGNYKILTDIQGPEDHHGDMDFKIAGTRKGVNAIQMDVKIDGITEEIFIKALEQGKQARYKILDEIEKVISEPRPDLSPYAPRILTIQINPEKIREVIGPGGKVINEIIQDCGVLIDIEEDGKVFVTAEKPEAGEKAIEWIKNIAREVKIGEIFQGKVKRILNFGAFVEILPNQEGMIHISKLADKRVDRVEDVVKIGDIVPVKVINIDDQGRIDLSLKDAKKEAESQNLK